MKFCFLTLWLILATIPQSAPAQTVEIPDAGLKSAIWQTLGRPLPAGTVTVPDMLSLINLDAVGRRIRSLEESTEFCLAFETRLMPPFSEFYIAPYAG